MTDDSKPIRERADKTPDHEVRGALLGTTITDVIHVVAYDDARGRSRDSLYLVLQDGSAVEIEAERLYFDLVPDYEGELGAIRIEAQNEGLRP